MGPQRDANEPGKSRAGARTARSGPASFSWGLAYEDRRIVPGAWDTLFADFAAHPPHHVIDAEGVLPTSRYPVVRHPRLEDYLAADYSLVHREADGLVYKRKTKGPHRE